MERKETSMRSRRKKQRGGVQGSIQGGGGKTIKGKIEESNNKEVLEKAKKREIRESNNGKK
jgi:hypothetical protein